MPSTEELIDQFNETSHVNSYVQFEHCDGESWILYVPYLYAQYYDAVSQPWIMSVMASILVGFSGIVPLLVIPIDDTATLKNGSELICHCVSSFSLIFCHFSQVY